MPGISHDDLDIPVLCYGLRTDFQGNLFPGSAALLGWADNLTELKTICHCGSKATMNLRTDEKGNAIKVGSQVEIGGAPAAKTWGVSRGQVIIRRSPLDHNHRRG